MTTTTSQPYTYTVGLGLLARVLLSLGPSYIHPDEHFQGPEQVARGIFGWSSQTTWEFAADANPIRSILPLYVGYGPPMLLVKCLIGNENPRAVFYGLRLWMFLLSLLSDYGVYRLTTGSKRNKNLTLLLATCYVTATYQCHTFSNSIETLIVVAFALLLNKALMITHPHHHHLTAVLVAFALGGVVVFGTFNRITFPGFILLPSLYFGPKLLVNHPFNFWVAALAGALVVAGLAVEVDSAHYAHPRTFTILNNISYNADTRNLEAHGLHPRYTHVLVNLPQLLGPALAGMWRRFPFGGSSNNGSMIALLLPISGIMVLSLVAHQEARFLIPVVPLLLALVSIRKYKRFFFAIWVGFNLVLGLVMGILHQGGVVPAQMHLANIHHHHHNDSDNNMAVVDVWWNTYPPPVWLLAINNTKSLILEQPGHTWSHRNVLGNVHHYNNLSHILMDSNHSHHLILDLMGSSPVHFNQIIEEFHQFPSIAPKIITPLRNSPHIDSSYTLQWSYLPHIDMDHLFDTHMNLNRLGIGIFS